jgi:hypothetical protein
LPGSTDKRGGNPKRNWFVDVPPSNETGECKRVWCLMCRISIWVAGRVETGRIVPTEPVSSLDFSIAAVWINIYKKILLLFFCQCNHSWR